MKKTRQLLALVTATALVTTTFGFPYVAQAAKSTASKTKITQKAVTATATPSVVPTATAKATVAPTATPKATTTVKLNKKKLVLTVGFSSKLKMVGTTTKPTWKSNKPKIAKVTKAGKVTAKKKGKAVITAKIGKKKYKCNVTVKNPVVIKATPTVAPTVEPTVAPTAAPTAVPTAVPTEAPTATPKPTAVPKNYATDIDLQNVSGPAVGVFDGYLTYVSIPDDKAKNENGVAWNCTSMQGMCIDEDTNIAYCVKIVNKNKMVANGLDPRQVVYWVDLNSRASGKVWNLNTGDQNFDTLYHANDMDIVTIDGEKYMYIVTQQADADYQIDIFKMEDSVSMREFKQCYVKIDGQEEYYAAGGISLLDFDEQGQPVFLFKKGKYLYQQKEVIDDTYIIEPVLMDNQNGNGLENTMYFYDMDEYENEITLENFLAQGMTYQKGKLFVPFTFSEDGSSAGDRSVILVYDVQVEGTKVVSVTKNSEIVVDISETDAPFEIEGCDVDKNGRLYFSANAADIDIVAYVKNYIVGEPKPTIEPTATPTVEPTQEPTTSPTVEPSGEPTESPAPTASASPEETKQPEQEPTDAVDTPQQTETPQPTEPVKKDDQQATEQKDPVINDQQTDAVG